MRQMHKLIECFWFFINSKPLTYFCYKRYFIYSLLFDIFWNYRLMMKTHFLQKFLRVQSEFPFVQLSLQSNTFSPSSKHFQSATSSGSLSFFFVKIIDTNIKYEELWRFRSNFKMSAPKKKITYLSFFGKMSL